MMYIVRDKRREMRLLFIGQRGAGNREKSISSFKYLKKRKKKKKAKKIKRWRWRVLGVRFGQQE